MRGDQFTRQWKILLSLLERKNGLTVQGISEELRVSIRTVYRDLEVLDRAGVPLVQEREGRNVRWRVMNTSFSGLVRTPGPGQVLSFTRAEAEALLRCVEGLTGPDLLPLKSLVRKVVASLPAQSAQGLQALLASGMD